MALAVPSGRLMEVSSSFPPLEIPYVFGCGGCGSSGRMRGFWGCLKKNAEE